MHAGTGVDAARITNTNNIPSAVQEIQQSLLIPIHTSVPHTHLPFSMSLLKLLMSSRHRMLQLSTAKVIISYFIKIT